MGAALAKYNSDREFYGSQAGVSIRYSSVFARASEPTLRQAAHIGLKDKQITRLRLQSLLGFVQSLTGTADQQPIQRRPTKSDAGGLGHRQIDLHDWFSLGGIDLHAAAAPLRAPEVTFCINASSIWFDA